MKKKNLFITISFLSIIYISMLLITMFRNDSVLTYFENRNIKAKPEMSIETIFNENYFGKLEDYLKDSFKGRNKLVELDTLINKSIIKRPVVNGVYCDKNLYLARWERWWPYDYKNDLKHMSEAYAKLNDKLKTNGINFIYVGVPEHSYVFSDKYPDYMLNKHDEWKEIEDAFFDELNKNHILNIKMSTKIKNRDLEYSKTDHHFSYLGAKNAYEEIIKTINENTKYKLDSNVELIKGKEEFRGSYARKLFFLGNLHDDYYTYKENFKYERFDDNIKSDDKLFFQEDNLYHGSMGYGVYMGGDKSFTEIKTDRNNLPNILVYGDSFTNPIETLLVRNANNFYSVDFRYKKDQSLMEIINKYKPDIVVCIRDNLMYLNKDDNGITE